MLDNAKANAIGKLAKNVKTSFFDDLGLILTMVTLLHPWITSQVS